MPHEAITRRERKFLEEVFKYRERPPRNEREISEMLRRISPEAAKTLATIHEPIFQYLKRGCDMLSPAELRRAGLNPEEVRRVLPEVQRAYLRGEIGSQGEAWDLIKRLLKQ